MKGKEEKGYFLNIITEHSIEDAGGFVEMMRMSREELIYTLQQIETFPDFNREFPDRIQIAIRTLGSDVISY